MKIVDDVANDVDYADDVMIVAADDNAVDDVNVDNDDIVVDDADNDNW